MFVGKEQKTSVSVIPINYWQVYYLFALTGVYLSGTEISRETIWVCEWFQKRVECIYELWVAYDELLYCGGSKKRHKCEKMSNQMQIYLLCVSNKSQVNQV